MGMFWWWPFGKVPELSAQQLDSLLRGEASPLLVDVRTRAEWRAGHIAGAVHVPIDELGARIAELPLDGANQVVAICRSAHRSVPAVRLLQGRGGVRACQLQGGMLAWQKAGLPVEVEA
jgi:rhodanese-related sulfurtransferase